jgi:glycosyltransferase EpsD
MANGEGADYNIPFEKKLFSPINTACRRDIARIIRREGFEAIVLNTSLAAFHVRLAIPKDIDKPRVINIVHGYLFSKVVGKIKRFMFILCERLLASRTDAIIVMKNEDMQASVKYKLSAGNTYMTRGMGADVRPTITPTEDIRREYRLEGRYVLAFVGELSERKNQEFLIKAHAKIKKKIPGAALVLVGDGAYREYYESVIDELDLADSVILMGYRNDACDVMRMADLYVSASSIEGMPFNIIEALGCGKTVLVSRVKGHTDLIEERRSGFFYEYQNEEEFIDKVCLIHSGVMKLDAEDIQSRYALYSKDKVFDETYKTICEALKDEK